MLKAECVESGGSQKKRFGPPQKIHPPFSKLGCPEGRSASTWVDYSLYGHQLVCHVVPGYSAAASANAVDGDPVPVPHFGLCLTVPQFHDLAVRVKAAGVQFVIEPHLRWPGQPGEQWTMFFKVKREEVVVERFDVFFVVGSHLFQPPPTGPVRQRARVQGHDDAVQPICQVRGARVKYERE